MNVLVLALALFGGAFFLQAFLWRIRIPRRHTPALLVLFTVVPFAVACVGVATGKPVFSVSDVFRTALLYTALCLAYIVIYSAIENQSPTLRLVAYVDRCTTTGCSDEELAARFGTSTSTSLDERIDAMLRGGWVETQAENIVLTPTGALYARLFGAAARAFGLPRGG